MLILDVDATYSSNSSYVLSRLTERQSQEVSIVVPDLQSTLGPELAMVSEGAARTIMIDNLNSMFHLLSADGEGYGGRRLAFVISWLSYLARTENVAVIFTMYQRESSIRIGRNSRISDVTDSTVTVSSKEGKIRLKGDRGPILKETETWFP
jgi:hypothetical protein